MENIGIYVPKPVFSHGQFYAEACLQANEKGNCLRPRKIYKYFRASKFANSFMVQWFRLHGSGMCQEFNHYISLFWIYEYSNNFSSIIFECLQTVCIPHYCFYDLYLFLIFFFEKTIHQKFLFVSKIFMYKILLEFRFYLFVNNYVI